MATIAAKLKAAVLSAIGHRLDYSALYPASVVRHTGGATIEVMPDSDAMRGLGMSRLPIRYGFPGAQCVVTAGARCLIGFDQQDPAKPYVALWDETAACSEVQLGPAGSARIKLVPATASVGSGSDYVAMAAKVDAYTAKMHALFTAGWVTVPADGGAALKAAYAAVFAVPPMSVASSNLKADG